MSKSTQLYTRVWKVQNEPTWLKSAPDRSEYVLENILEYEEYITEQAQRVAKHTQFRT